MRLLKKASIHDILKEGIENVTLYYKEIELYITWNDINELDNDKLEKLIEQLNKNNAIISAIHCPESLYKTSNDEFNSTSSNYLSICEAIKDEVSQEKLKKIMDFSKNIYCSQWRTDKDIINVDQADFDNEDIINEKAKHDKILLIVHSGCEIGCQKCNEDKASYCNIPKDIVNEEFKRNLKNDFVQIVIENITPYLDEKDSEAIKGQNCGWSNEKRWNCFDLAKELGVGVCVDICHILASHNIMNNDTNYSKALEEYSKYIKNNRLESTIMLFHLANYDENGTHGAQFDNTDSDNDLIEKIRNFCFEVSPNSLITLEVADGEDYEKACRNFDKLMMKLSERHTSGLFGRLLRNDTNTELNQFFDDLYYSYTSSVNDIFELRECATRIKKYIVSNTYQIREDSQISHPFNFSKESSCIDTALFRMQAYIYYTRFCNLAIFLANYYNEESIIPQIYRAEDFALSLKYFMFNDGVKLIEYTGIAFRFNVDWLPKKETFFRFFDGIYQNNFDKNAMPAPMSHIINIIREHIQGDCHLFSCGRNFGSCLFKYWQPLKGKGAWTVRIYENTPINFIEYGYGNRRYSIPAFMQYIGNGNIEFNNVNNFSFDLSRFQKGRGEEKSNEKNASSLFSLFRYYTGNISSCDRTGSISDGEIVFLLLPEIPTTQYAFSEYVIIVLLKAYLYHISSKEDITEDNLREIVDKLNNLPSNEILQELVNSRINAQDLKNIEELLIKVSKTEKNSKDVLLKTCPLAFESKQFNEWFENIESRL